MAIQRIKHNDRDLRISKSILDAHFSNRTVLTNSSWAFVSLWLKRNCKGTNAEFYWQQAKEFSDAAVGLPIDSAPLLQYYSYLNAAKALLSSKQVSFDQMHGVVLRKLPVNTNHISNIGVKIMLHGVLPALSTYLGETESNRFHSLKDIFFNIPYVHRTYCLTHRNQKDMYIPLNDCHYSYDDVARQVRFRANLSKDFIGQKYRKRLPASLEVAPDDATGSTIQSVAFVNASSHRLSPAELDSVSALNRSVRHDVDYIAGNQTLWYAKGVVQGPPRLNRTPLVLSLAAMHRISEICRYNPIQLNALMSGQKNWLINEFIQMSPAQFMDQISTEITGYQFLLPNVRTAT
ncbi:YaaC family protein [Deinococcus humi]|uniref:Uncharacterized protein n=1 Tax=Deinococcus humi TaxID=662880 RepID=A0A7W8JZM8_9DEIO|nr:YaaC family protein [Deinococcus humi]MBB5366170.1 hypothetical protein [Deinococcus humi]